MGADGQWSWSFAVGDAAYEERDGRPIRLINKLAEKPYEVSPVLVGAGMGTQTVAIKALKAAIGEAVADPAFVAELGQKLIEAALKAEWTAAFINDLPDSAFAYVESGGEKDEGGKTAPRSLRHFPHHGADGAVDLPHLRNALARAPQSPVGERALPHLRRHASAEDVGEQDSASTGGIETRAAKPMPTPSTDESEADFIDRCMGDETMVADFEEAGQRRAVCQTQWDNAAEEASKAAIEMILGRAQKTMARLAVENGEISNG
jgi:hypothetical protein